MPLIDLEPWYSYVLKTERPEVVEGAPSSTPSRASTTYEPEQKVTVSLLIEISKEIMSLYGKAKKGAASVLQALCFWLSCLYRHEPDRQCNVVSRSCGQDTAKADHKVQPKWHMLACGKTSASAAEALQCAPKRSSVFGLLALLCS